MTEIAAENIVEQSTALAISAPEEADLKLQQPAPLIKSNIQKNAENKNKVLFGKFTHNSEIKPK